MCEKVGEDHYQATEILKKEKAELIESKGKLALDLRDYMTRNKRQEDFIFQMQGKMDDLQQQNKGLTEQIEALQKKEEESVPEPEEDVKEFRQFGQQTDLVRVLPIVKTCDADVQVSKEDLLAYMNQGE